MISIVSAVPVRRLPLVCLLACCLFTALALPGRAEETPSPCDPAAAAPAPALDFLSTAPPPVRTAALLPACGAAGQRCCLNNTCDYPLVCNSSGVCRQPCGDAGQRCCTGSTCNSTNLACNSSGICRTCGGTGDICCSGNTCNNGNACNNGRCETCGGYNQLCCNGSCNPGYTCAFGINRCGPCGNPGEICCGGTTCNFPSTCNLTTGTCK